LIASKAQMTWLRRKKLVEAVCRQLVYEMMDDTILDGGMRFEKSSKFCDDMAVFARTLLQDL
jgi:hypothetical protein